MSQNILLCNLKFYLGAPVGLEKKCGIPALLPQIYFMVLQHVCTPTFFNLGAHVDRALVNIEPCNSDD